MPTSTPSDSSRPSRWHGEAVAIAVVTGLLSLGAATLGAYIGGQTANDGAKQIQGLVARRQDEREHRAAQAAARLLSLEFQQITAWFAAEGSSAAYRRLLAVRFPRSDRLLLASSLAPERWNELIAGLQSAANIQPVAHRQPWIRARYNAALAGFSVACAEIALEPLAGTTEDLLEAANQSLAGTAVPRFNADDCRDRRRVLAYFNAHFRRPGPPTTHKRR